MEAGGLTPPPFPPPLPPARWCSCSPPRPQVLSDHVSRKTLPEGLKCRLILPTSGTQSVSVWDSPDMHTIHSWVEESLSEYCASECFQIVEEHSFGLQMELARARATETVAGRTQQVAGVAADRAKQVAASATATAAVAAQQVRSKAGSIDQKYDVTTRAKQAGTQVTKNAKVAMEQASKTATTVQKKAMENQAVAKGVNQARKGLSFLSAKMSQLGQQVQSSVQEYNTAAGERRASRGDEQPHPAAPAASTPSQAAPAAAPPAAAADPAPPAPAAADPVPAAPETAAPAAE